MEYTDSPPYLHEGDFDSSSNDSSSSPSDSTSSHYASPGQDTQASWAIDLGLSTLPSVHAGIVTLPQSTWAASDVAYSKPPRQEEHPLTLTSDFWSTAPSTTVHSPAGGATAGYRADYFDGDEVKMEHDDEVFSAHDETMAVDFDSMVQEGAYGPSSLPSPRDDDIDPSSNPAPLHLSMPVDLLAVNAGISPQLTGGQPSPPAEDEPTIDDEVSHGLGGTLPTTLARSERSSRSSNNSNDGDGSAGPSRESSRVRAPAPKARKAAVSPYSTTASSSTTTAAPNASATAPAPSTTFIPPVASVGASTNLVTKDAVIASHILTSIALPPRAGSQPMELLVLGVPTIGAKSRVETQIKITLALVSTRPGVVSTKDQAVGDGQGVPGGRFITPDGGLEYRADAEYERVGGWTHLRLPRLLAIKKKGKKALVEDPPPEDTLNLSVAVVRSSAPHPHAPSDEIFICQGCQAREHKRAQRKKDSRSAAGAAAAAEEKDEEEERRKVVVFNCAEFVEFGGGETVLPTRITCYCRHHKEKKGFQVSFTLRDSADTLVAQGITPPIMITDDHKTKDPLNRAANVSTSTSHSQELSFESVAEPTPAKAKRGKTTTKSKKEKAGAAVSASGAPSSRPKRGASGRAKAARGQTESGDDEAESATSSTNARAPAPSKKAKPYDSDARPSRKRTPNGTSHRSPAFAMTPLGPLSPSQRTVELAALPPPIAPIPAAQAASPIDNIFEATPALNNTMQTEESEQWPASALGLDVEATSFGDAMMNDPSQLAHPRQPSFSTDASSAPSPNVLDWHSTHSSASSPVALSPGSNPPSNVDFNSFFGAFSPSAPTTATHTAPSALSPPPVEYPFSEALATPPAPPTTSWAPSLNQSQSQAQPSPPLPRIGRLIPGEGPVHGAIEVTVLGDNFVPNLVCVFGDSPAATHYWSANTLVCVLPPSANPGPVVVGIKGVPLTVEQANGLQLFTYKDDSDRSLLELALQVVGLKMTGRLEDASAVAMRIVGNNQQGGAAGGSTGGSRHASPTGTTTYDTAGLAQTLNAAASSVYNSPNSSRPSSRAHSRRGSLNDSNLPPPLPYSTSGGEARNFEGIVIKFLSLLDLDPSLIPGSAPSLPSSQPPISHLNSQDHNLLHLATVLGFHRLVQFLLARGIDYDSPDRNGFTPLHFAALYGRVAIARQLIDAGAQANARNLAGKTALDIAQDRDDVDVEDILQRARFTSAAQARTPRSRFALPSLGYPASTSPSALYPSPARTSAQRSSSLASSYHSRYASTRGSPVSSYGEELERAPEDEDDEDDFSEEEQSDFSRSDHFSDSEDSDEDSDDGSFHSSDEDSDGYDLERRRSRNASMVSLHYLLEAEANATSQVAAPISVKEWPLLDSKSAPVSGESSPRDVPSTPSADSITPTHAPLHQLASASSAWLFNRGNPADKDVKSPINARPRRNPPTFHDKLQPLSDGMNDMWEKAKANRLYIPLQIQMPELTAFQTMASNVPAAFSKGWLGSKAEEVEVEEGGGAETGAESDATVMPSRSTRSSRDEKSAASQHRDWRTLYGGPWFKSPSSPPPMYTATDSLQGAPPGRSSPRTPPSLELSPLPSPPPVASTSKVMLQARPQKKVAVPEKEKAFDQMLVFFWIPVLLAVVSFTIYANFDLLRPFLDHVLDLVLR
ncbi:hypothetical protein BCR35DRAFT_306973 [Leucosporidium creatinivorum]|uniref:IPT/TIG domain-containing protein n=1 Tax=Leucosporidium creatinivorum TaxID=106004 RepID=A0A1Y2EQJ3_9BASI|nr:hypothetical protein BCR35DRAFT_306973 [Leucosporidium creatinivorum]